jgi:hypothetical protein
MRWVRGFVVVAALIACKASHSDASDAGPQPSMQAAPAGSIEVKPAASGSADTQRTETDPARGSVHEKAEPAAPLSSSLTELGRATELPELEGEPAIAVFVERVSGGLMPDIEHATSRLRAGLRACYLRSHGDDPPDASRLSLRIVVSTSGSVKSAKPEGVSEIDDSAVDCMVRRAQTATFPAPVGEPAEIILSIAFLPPRFSYR